MSRIKESSQRIKPSLVPWACFGFDKISNIDTTVSKTGFGFKQQRKHIVFFFFEIEIEINGF